jgi:acyl dehydratase
MPYYEDLKLGQKVISPSRTITDGMATVLIDVGGFTADQFNDKVSANKTILGWRAIPGRLVFALMGGLVERMKVFDTPGPGMLVGADKLVWKGPLRVGDTIHLEWEVTEMRETSNPRWGLVKNKETLLNQNDEVICTVEIAHLFEYKKNKDEQYSGKR